MLLPPLHAVLFSCARGLTFPPLLLRVPLVGGHRADEARLHFYLDKYDELKTKGQVKEGQRVKGAITRVCQTWNIAVYFSHLDKGEPLIVTIQICRPFQ